MHSQLRSAFALGILFGNLPAAVHAAAFSSEGQEQFHPGSFWCAGAVPSSRIPVVGDMDGDGRADLLTVSPDAGGFIDVIRTSNLGKPCFPERAFTGLGGKPIAAMYGPFASGRKTAVVVVLESGEVRLVHDVKPDGRAFARNEAAGNVAKEYLPRGPIQSAAGDVDGDADIDGILLGSDGRLLLLRNTTTADGATRFEGVVVNARAEGAVRFAAGDLEGNGRADMLWSDSRGEVWRAEVGLTGSRGRITRRTRLIAGSAGEGLVLGRFVDPKRLDVLSGKRLLPSGDPNHAIPQNALPDSGAARGDFAWLAGDLDADGRDELLRVRRDGERFTGSDIVVHSAHAALADTDGDGLLDAWETGEVHPGGLDLESLGCSPRRRDIIVEVQRMPDMPAERVHSEMERVARYYRSLPLTNSNFTTGVTLHVIEREAIAPEDARKPWWELGAKYHPANHRGITHWMVVYNGGGGQSGEMTDRGGCGGSALFATFIHEFGHQLGLGHTGFWNAAWCPVYPSLMNYAYSYQVNGRADAIGYSDGRLAALRLDERDLSERLPLAPDKVTFLAGPPYRYRLKPGPGGQCTLIDWNWNGIFGEEHVTADINYGYSTSAGLRHTIGKSYTAPAVAVCGSGRTMRLLIFSGDLPEGAPAPAASASELKHSLSTDLPGRLRMRVWLGLDPAKEGGKWSPPVDLASAGVVGDPSAATLDGTAWIAYPSLEGVRIRPITPGRDQNPTAGSETLVPETKGALPTLTICGRELVLLLWRDARIPIGIRTLRARKEALSCEPERALTFASNLPVGACLGEACRDGETIRVALSQDQDPARLGRWQIRKLTRGRGGMWTSGPAEWIGGEKGQERGSTRPAILWEPGRAGTDGQLRFFGGGSFGKDSPWSCHYSSTRIADATVNGGWLTRRFYDEWTQSRSAPGVCFWGGDIVFASRWFGNVRGTENDNLFVGFYGRGIDPQPMGDFDDIAFIGDVGITHSIAYVAHP